MTSTGWAPLGLDNTPAPGTDDTRVFIALPTYGGMNAEFVGTLLQCLQQTKSRIQILQGDSLVARARNNLAHDFMTNTRVPFLLFFDTDLVLDAEGVKHLLNLPPEYAVVGGCYPKKKTGPAEWVCNVAPGSAPDENGLQEVREMGTGMLRVHRSVFAAIREAYPQLHYTCDGNKDTRVDYFRVGTFPDPLMKITRYLSEDWFFCQMAKAIGFKIWADTKCAARHIGQVAYPFPAEQQITAESIAAAANANPNPNNGANMANFGANVMVASSPESPLPQPPAKPNENS